MALFRGSPSPKYIPAPAFTLSVLFPMAEPSVYTVMGGAGLSRTNFVLGAVSAAFSYPWVKILKVSASVPSRLVEMREMKSGGIVTAKVWAYGFAISGELEALEESGCQRA